ncbi:MAG: CPBP family intramembrane glutamic endopeptidase [bacterium]
MRNNWNIRKMLKISLYILFLTLCWLLYKFIIITNLKNEWLDIATLIFFGIIILVITVILSIIKEDSLKEALGFKKVKLTTIVNWLASFLTVAFLIVPAIIMIFRLKGSNYATEIYASSFNVFLTLLKTAILVPILEELIFRGLLYYLLEKVHVVMYILVSSAIWSVLHVQYDLFIILTIFVYGIIWGVARVNSKSIYPPIIMHSVYNLIISLFVMMG